MLSFDKESLIRMVAKQADFTLGDVRTIFEALEDCIYDIVKNGNQLKWYRVMKLYVRDIAAYSGWNPISSKAMVVPAHKRIYITPSKVMHDFINGEETISAEDKINE